MPRTPTASAKRLMRRDEAPNDLLAKSFTCDAVSTIYRPEDVTFRHAGWRCPRIDGHLHPGGHRRGADPTVLSDQVNDAPAAIALFDVRQGERSSLGPSQAAADKNGENSSVAQSPQCRDKRGASSACACFCDGQFPVHIPCFFALFTREMPAGSSGPSRPLSAASAANLRIADIRMMIDDEPRRRSSSDTRHVLTVALVKPGRGAC
jgi:hypothetical protein